MKKKLLTYYEHHLAVIKKSKKGFDSNYSYCVNKILNKGLCAASYHVFDKLIFETKWVKKELTKNQYFGIYWFKTPEYCTTTKELIECLEYRINKLKTLI